MHRLSASAVLSVVGLLVWTPVQPVLAGNGSGGPMSAGEINGECAVIPSAVDQTAPSTILNGTWAWTFILSSTLPNGGGFSGSVTVNSGFGAPTLISEPGKGPFPCGPGAPLSSLPFTTSSSCGACLNVNLGSTIAAQETAGYSLTRNVEPLLIPPHGRQQTTTVALAGVGDCTVADVISPVSGATVASTSATGGASLLWASGPSAAFGFGCDGSYAGQPATLTVTFNVPNPFGRPFDSKPEIQLFDGSDGTRTPSCNGFAPSGVFDPGPTGSETLFDSTLDGESPGAGYVTFSLDGYSGSWNRSQGCATFVDYQSLVSLKGDESSAGDSH